MEAQIIVSASKVKLNSNYGYYDLFSFKKFHQSNILIPETLILENGFIKQWIFNSGKMANHPLLKKKKENMSIFSAVKSFFHKFGLSNISHNCSTIVQLYDSFKNHKNNLPEEDIKKNRKCLQITTIDNEQIQMSVSQFFNSILDIHRQPRFEQKWKLIQEKVVYQKIQEYYIVENVRANHLIESKCEKKIKVRKGESPRKNTEVEEEEKVEQREESYKFFDVILNKKFFVISSELIESIQKNYKCVVESVRTKFIINSQRQPYLVGMYDLQIKPHKDISHMKDYQLKKQKGHLMIEQYIRLQEVFLSKSMGESQPTNNEQKKNQMKKKKKNCKGRFCKVLIKQNLPPPDNKFKVPGGPRVVKVQMRDATLKNQLLVLQVLKDYKIIEFKETEREDSVQESSQNELILQPKERIVKLKPIEVKVCENCFRFYFYVGRYFEVNEDYELVEKKRSPKMKGSPKFPKNLSEFPETEKQLNLIKKPHTQLPFEIKPVTNISPQKLGKTSLAKNKSQPKFLSPLQKTKQSNKMISQFKSDKKLPPSQSKIKLDPLIGVKRHSQKEQINKAQLNLPSVSHLNLKERIKPQKKTLIPLSQRRPQNYVQSSEQLVKKLSSLSHPLMDQFKFEAKKFYKQNMPQPLDRRGYSTFYLPNLYEFMSTSPIMIHPKKRIKKRPEMSLKRLSELTDYPEIVSRSQFIFDTLIVNEQTTVPFCIITTKAVEPENIKQQMPFQNIFIINDLFDSFIEHIAMAKQMLEQQNCFNKRVILLNYPGQCHTIYNPDYTTGISGNFSVLMDKLLYRLSTQKGQLKAINLKKDNFKFCAFGYGGYLLTNFLGSHHAFFNKITGVFLLNSFMEVPSKYEQMLRNLLILYSSDDPTAKSESYFFYNKAINSSEVQNEDLAQKAGVNPIRLSDRVYLIKSVLKEIEQSKTKVCSARPLYFETLQNCHVSVVHGNNNIVIPKASSQQFLTYRKNLKKEISGRLFRQLQAGHDSFADNYDDIFQMLSEFFCK